MAWSSTDRTSSGWLDVASTVMREKRVPWYSPRTRTLTSASSRPRLRTTCATASAKHAPSEASSSSVGFGPVSVPPAVVGSSTSTSKPRIGTRHRCPPSHEAVISSMASESSPPAPPGPLSSPLPEQVRAVNVGLSLFGEALRAQGAEAMDVDWRIPARGQPSLVGALTRLSGRHAERVDQANREAVRRLDEGVAVLVEVGPAADLVPGMGRRTILHPGPPLSWERFCDPLRRSVLAAVMAEGWAATGEEAAALVAAEGVDLEPANDHHAVVPMASAVGPSAPVFAVENRSGSNRAFSGLNQGPGRTPWYGVDAPEAVDRLRFLRDAAGPVLAAALHRSGPVDVLSLASQGLHMGDDGHMRTQASTNLLIRQLLPYLAEVGGPDLPAVARFLSENHLFFLNLVMAAAKTLTDWAGEVADASVVTGMARNGTTFGVRLAATGQRWFTSPAPAVEQALFHAGYGPADGAPDIGDSAVLELVGLGGAAAAASPAVATFLGGGMAKAVAATEAMGRICLVRSARFKLPFLDLWGSPVGVDLRKVVETGVTPSINTGILHRSAGTGQVGAGVASAPLACFEHALLALDERLGAVGRPEVSVR